MSRPRRLRGAAQDGPPRLQLLRADGARGPARELRAAAVAAPACSAPRCYRAVAPVPLLGMIAGDTLVHDHDGDVAIVRRLGAHPRAVVDLLIAAAGLREAPR